MTVNKAKRDNAVVCVLEAGSQTQAFDYNTVDEKTAVIISNTHASDVSEVTVKAGNGMRSSIGDLVVTVNAGETVVLGPLDSMRFKDLTTGQITIEISGGTTTLNVIAL
ncbi:MAG: hypothetical protein IJA19_01590 [Clostridia bacterium]|nr:hypothetical protein [Clostridia bacterium]MBQ4542840.1 hypothetical protein [Clostridia bacterium]MBQ9997530.1 hypothetical protein [Clostridia bacterium]